ncbi:MAG: hypothetical protein SOX43_07955 [Pelistega sp.]|nr:hypothetical protein [Pelistega sp.]
MFRVMIPTLTLATAGDPATNLGSIDSKAGSSSGACFVLTDYFVVSLVLV